MTTPIFIDHLPEFDITKSLRSEQDIAEYLALAHADGDPALLTAVSEDIARARAIMAQ